MQRNSVTVTPQAYAFYQHEYSDSSRTLDARLSQVGSAFTFLSGEPHRNFAVLGADVTIATKKNLKVQLDYNAEVGRGNYTAHYISAGLRWEF
jgi:outer membrane autotransporter protein